MSATRSSSKRGNGEDRAGEPQGPAEAGPGGVRVVRFDVIDSTSLEARRRLGNSDADDVARGGDVVYVARRQTGGVGRMGRAYASPEGGVWMTLAHRLGPEPGRGRVIEGLGLRVGVACLETVLAAWGWAGTAGAGDAPVRLKWPNDVLVGGKKVVGALTEVVRSGGEACVLVGVGVNANVEMAELPADVRERATSIAEATGTRVDLERLLAELVGRVRGALADEGVPGATLRVARERLAGVGEAMHAAESGVSGVLVGLREDGRPEVRTQGGVVALEHPAR